VHALARQRRAPAVDALLAAFGERAHSAAQQDALEPVGWGDRDGHAVHNSPPARPLLPAARPYLPRARSLLPRGRRAPAARATRSNFRLQTGFDPSSGGKNPREI
jgi:hypothetical protein